jgi:hypothetical protein
MEVREEQQVITLDEESSVFEDGNVLQQPNETPVGVVAENCENSVNEILAASKWTAMTVSPVEMSSTSKEAATTMPQLLLANLTMRLKMSGFRLSG